MFFPLYKTLLNNTGIHLIPIVKNHSFIFFGIIKLWDMDNNETEAFVTQNDDISKKIEEFRKVVTLNMKKRRIEMQFTQETLADKTNLSTETIAKLENQKQWFSVESLIKICEALQTTPCQLFMNPRIDKLIPVAEVFSLADRYSMPQDIEDKEDKKTYHVYNSRRNIKSNEEE